MHSDVVAIYLVVVTAHLTFISPEKSKLNIADLNLLLMLKTGESQSSDKHRVIVLTDIENEPE